ncbi:MAG: M56 family metallopeptidase [Bryobacteraceae bacterium]
MILPYLSRLLCLALGSFFLIHTAASFGVWLVSNGALRRSTSLEPALGARFLFCLRLFPLFFSGLLVLALLGPSYLMFEPQAPTETMGVICLLTATLGAVLFASGILRGIRAVIRSARYLKRQEESGAPMILVAGFFRPRIIVSPAVRNSLTDEELAAALRHEEAHARARDNLKRLLVVLCPSTFPFLRRFGALEAGWRRSAEWAADDAAIQNSTRHAVALASALIRVGRMNAGFAPVPLATSLFDGPADLRARVERLIEGPRTYGQLRSGSILYLLALIFLTLMSLSPELLPASHRFLEVLAH